MLALMPQLPPLSDLYVPPTPTMSLAVLPSAPLTYGHTSKRPKLTLNTSSAAPVYGKNATSLRLDTLSATSPTARNTFRNAHNPHKKALKSTLASLSTDIPTVPEPTTITPIAQVEQHSNAPERPSPAASETSVSTVDTTLAEPPYKLSFNTSSILTNGPIPRTRGRMISFSQSRPMFPSPKKVIFRTPLTEEVKTSRYTLRHSDIPASTSSPSRLALSDSTTDEAEPLKDAQARKPKQMDAARSPRTGEKRDSSDEEDSDACPATPIAGRRKRHRQWRWTLAPVSPSTETKQKREVAVSEVDEAVDGEVPS